jgi:hypothetical protein
VNANPRSVDTADPPPLMPGNTLRLALLPPPQAAAISRTSAIKMMALTRFLLITAPQLNKLPETDDYSACAPQPLPLGTPQK